MLDDLLKIKRLREDEAIAALAKARGFLEQQIVLRDKKRQDEVDYKTWRLGEEERLYNGIYGKKVALSKLEKLRERIACLRQKELQLHEEYLQADQDVATARTALDEARQRRLEAHKETNKYVEYRQIVRQEEQRAAERREETEIEDLLSRKP